MVAPVPILLVALLDLLLWVLLYSSLLVGNITLRSDGGRIAARIHKWVALRHWWAPCLPTAVRFVQSGQRRSRTVAGYDLQHGLIKSALCCNIEVSAGRSMDVGAVVRVCTSAPTMILGRLTSMMR